MPQINYYSQVNGSFYLAKKQIGTGYSGTKGLLNDKNAESVTGGPIPRGRWYIDTPRDHPHLGPITFPLSPIGHDAHGRQGFYIHGPHRDDHHDSSHGCIVLQYGTRQLLKAAVESGARELVVF